MVFKYDFAHTLLVKPHRTIKPQILLLIVEEGKKLLI